MATLKNTTAPAADVLVRFSVGAAEILAADVARGAGEDEAVAFRSFYEQAVVAHALPLDALLPRGKDEDRRSNEEQAAYDFGVKMFYSYMFGADIAAQMADRNVKADTVLGLSAFISKATGKPYKDQAKRAVAQSFGGTPWKLFVGRLFDLSAYDDKAAKVATGLMTEAEAEAEAGEKRGTKSTSTEMQRVLNKIGEVIKLLRREPEKRDGSIDLEVSQKLAAYLADGLNAYGIK
jgi:hypothetical protein